MTRNRKLKAAAKACSPTDSSSPMVGLSSATAPGAIEKVCVLLRDQTGHDFSKYKRGTLCRRVERRMGMHQIDGVAGYLRYMQENPQETTLLFKELLIGVTSFFRDPEAWNQLQKKEIPALVAKRPGGGVLRAWVAGCSTGEEAYSLAIVLKEALAEAHPAGQYSVQIFATDPDKDAIERARQGVYPSNIVSDVTQGRLGRFFVEEERGYRVCQEIRESVVFANHNVIMDPPFSKLDILSCRNLLIYLTPALQAKLLPLFHYSLNPGGILFLGTAESLGPVAALFGPMSSKNRIYRRLGAAATAGANPGALDFPASFEVRPQLAVAATASGASPAGLQAQATQLLLARYSPAAVLTNPQGDILHISGQTGKYLEPAAGKADWNIHAMAREGLREALGDAFHRAVRDGRGPRRIRVRVPHGAVMQTVDVTVDPLHGPDSLRGLVMIVFDDVTVSPVEKRMNKRGEDFSTMKGLGEALRRARSDLRLSREEMQRSEEVSKSAKEELQSTNEELQSMNEELSTSKEEMQSLNEELQTVNHELQAKVDVEARTNDDMRNLLDSTDIATLFLDEALKIRRFTPRVTSIIKVLPGDVGRPITDLASDLVYPDLVPDAQDVLRTLVLKETPVRTVDARWFLVRIMPYRTVDNHIDGVVITVVDITAAKTLEPAVRQSQPTS